MIIGNLLRELHPGAFVTFSIRRNDVSDTALKKVYQEWKKAEPFTADFDGAKFQARLVSMSNFFNSDFCNMIKVTIELIKEGRLKK